jgi:uncharacterized protein (TIGR02453 family)
MAFSGFPPETLAFLEGIGANNNREWFTANRPLYDATVEASKALVMALGPELRKSAPAVQFDPRVGGSLPRPNRDTRFDKTKAPYKEQLDLWFWHGDKKGWDQPGFFLRIAPGHLWIAAGMMHILWPQLQAFRDAVVDERSGTSLVVTVDRINAIGRYQVGYPTRKSVPKGFDPAHPARRVSQIRKPVGPSAIAVRCRSWFGLCRPHPACLARSRAAHRMAARRGDGPSRRPVDSLTIGPYERQLNASVSRSAAMFH